MALAHNFLPHTHPKEEGKEKEHRHSDSEKSHSHEKDGHHHSHSNDSKEQLPVFTHFANADITVTTKYSYTEKQQLVLEFEQPVLISLPLPAIPCFNVPIPHARDLPQGFLPLVQSLRAPPCFLS